MVIKLKNTKKIVNSRRDKILLEIQTKNKVLVNDLAYKLNVSPLTIRRDLEILEQNGFIDRFYGGAKFRNIKNNDFKSLSKETLIKSIAMYATRYVEDNDTIFMNSSNTALYMIPYIKNKNVTIITNNCRAIYLDKTPNVYILLTGGEINTPKNSLTGEFALNNLKKITANKAFIGCSGITSRGITTVVPQEVTINEYMLDRCSGSVFVLADNSKIGKEYSFLSGSINQINTLITDAHVSDELINIEKKGVNVVRINYEE